MRWFICLIQIQTFLFSWLDLSLLSLQQSLLLLFFLNIFLVLLFKLIKPSVYLMYLVLLFLHNLLLLPVEFLHNGLFILFRTGFDLLLLHQLLVLILYKLFWLLNLLVLHILLQVLNEVCDLGLENSVVGVALLFGLLQDQELFPVRQMSFQQLSLIVIPEVRLNASICFLISAFAKTRCAQYTERRERMRALTLNSTLAEAQIMEWSLEICQVSRRGDRARGRREI